MKLIKIIIASVLLPISLLLGSCKNDIDIDLSNVKSQLTLNGYINADSTTNTLYVSLTGIHHPTEVNNATVKVTVNGQLRETVTSTQDNRGNYILNGKLNPGDIVRIDVTTDDGSHHAYIEETVPQPIQKLENITCRIVNDKRVISDFYGTRNEDMYNLKVDITDDAAESNFYHIALKVYTSYLMSEKKWGENLITQKLMGVQNYYTEQLYLADDPIIMEGKVLQPSTDLDIASTSNIPNKYGVFNDAIMNGQTNTLSIYNPIGWLNEETDNSCQELNNPNIYSHFQCTQKNCDLQLILSSYTPSAYYYLKAMNFKESVFYDDNSDLTGPVKLPSNVKGGTGLVGVFTSKALALHLYGPYRTPTLFND